jgi:hypothetical protein
MIFILREISSRNNISIIEIFLASSLLSILSSKQRLVEALTIGYQTVLLSTESMNEVTKPSASSCGITLESVENFNIPVCLYTQILRQQWSGCLNHIR